RMPPHRVLAINRGERAKVLRVRIESDLQTMVNILDESVVPPGHPHAEYLRGCARDALSRLILPSLEREVRRELTDRAETHAVSVFAKNLRNLLLQPPIHDHRVLAVDPGFRSGCKLAALDQFGNLLDHGVIHLVGKPDRRDEAKKMVLDLIERHQLTVVVIGNGTACRQTEDFFAELIESEPKDKGVAYVIVNEAGASVYSTSRVGREEFPDCDAVLRGAISIGRRLQDPLSELVKIDPANIGVGLYQHDVKAKHLRASLDEVVESCVNYVGVDANTASPALLRYVSGLNQLTARRLCEFRREHGPFRSRQRLREVPGFGEATFVQAAGFLKISRGENPLDATWIHPESYERANRALQRLFGAEADLGNKETIAALAEPIAEVDLESLAKELEIGELTLKDILLQLVRPGRDPRENLPAPIFKRGVLKLEDLAPDMELTGTVLNVVDFGCFVDIGMHQSGLVHVSRLADKFVRDPHDVVAVGDIVKVWVLGIDKERQRVSLTMVQPGTERPKHPRRGGKPSGDEAPAHDRDRGPRRPPQRTATGGRPPRHKAATGGRAPHGRGQHRPGQRRPPYRPQPATKPLNPITEEMKSGNEPMRTFGDLMQFYQQKPATKENDDSPPAREDAPAVKAVEDKSPPAVEQETPPIEKEATPPTVDREMPPAEKAETPPPDPPTATADAAEESDEQPRQE
ncbi:MAG: helix-hairpin-helix domain-containing protein, partial [Planctomycetes bacterium]|nr:helix-hairpin-helix domain-containing protein [Planctomycetota bacterium]